jgi:hypothetical protein
MHELVPNAATVAYLMNPTNPNADFELSAAQECRPFSRYGFAGSSRQQRK